MGTGTGGGGAATAGKRVTASPREERVANHEGGVEWSGDGERHNSARHGGGAGKDATTGPRWIETAKAGSWR